MKQYDHTNIKEQAVENIPKSSQGDIDDFIFAEEDIPLSGK